MSCFKHPWVLFEPQFHNSSLSPSKNFAQGSPWCFKWDPDSTFEHCWNLLSSSEHLWAPFWGANILQISLVRWKKPCLFLDSLNKLTWALVSRFENQCSPGAPISQKLIFTVNKFSPSEPWWNFLSPKHFTDLIFALKEALTVFSYPKWTLVSLLIFSELGWAVLSNKCI